MTEASIKASYMYDQLGTRADNDGTDFEAKYLTLLLLRGINGTDSFSLGCNMKHAGSFDDAVFTFVDRDTRRKHSVFVQLKHKKDDAQGGKKVLAKHALLSISGNFALAKYCNSYHESKTSFTQYDKEHFGEFDSYKFVLFTNASLDKDLVSETPTGLGCSPTHSMVNTSDKDNVKVFNDDFCTHFIKYMVALRNILKQISDVLEGVDESNWKDVIGKLGIEKEMIETAKTQNKSFKNFMESPTKLKLDNLWKEFSKVPDYENFTEFFKQFELYTDQKSQHELDDLIKQELVMAKHVSKYVGKKELHYIYEDLYRRFVQPWWNLTDNKMACISENHDGWASHCVKTLSRKKQSELDAFQKDVTFRGDELTRIKDEISNMYGFKVVVDESTTLTTLKFCQAMQYNIDTRCLEDVQSLHVEDEQHKKVKQRSKSKETNKAVKNSKVVPGIAVSLNTLLSQMEGVLHVWQYAACRTLVVECEQQLNPTSQKLDQLLSAIDSICTTATEPLRCVFISRSHGTFVDNLKTSMVSFSRLSYENRWSQLTQESAEKLLSKTVKFQGRDVARNVLINDANRLTEHMNGECLSELSLQDLPIGPDLDVLIPDFIPRRLIRDKQTIDVVRANQISDGIVLLTAEPGMGKSTFLTQIALSAKDDNENVWVLRINLNDCTKYLKDNTFDDDEKLRVFFIACNDLTTEVEKTLLGKCLFNAETLPMIILIDGVDEVWSVYKDNVCRLLEKLRCGHQKQLWVASRVLCRDTLERILGVKTYALEPFHVEDQREFFKRFWKSAGEKEGLNVSEEQCIKFTDHVMKQATEMFKGENLLVSNPLLIRMVAKYFVDALQVFVKSGSLETVPVRIDVILLFERITYKIFTRYCALKKHQEMDNSSVKIDIESQWELLKQQYMNAALFLLVATTEEIQSLISVTDTKAFIQRIKEGKEITGIIDYVTDDDVPHFTNRPIAEYFAALWLQKSFSEEPCRNFIRNNFAKPAYNVVFWYFDRMLVRNITSTLHSAVLCQDLDVFQAELDKCSETRVDTADAGGRTALHVAVMCSGVLRVPVFRSMIAMLLAKGASAEHKDVVLRWTPMHYADYTQDWFVVKLLLHAVKVTDKTQDMTHSKQNMNEKLFHSFTGFLVSRETDLVKTFHITARYGDESMLAYLVKDCGADVECVSDGGTRPMHTAAAYGNITAMTYLRSEGASYMTADGNGNSPLMHAAKCNQSTAVRCVLQWADQDKQVLVNVTNNNGWSALMLGVDAGNTDIVEDLTARGATADLEGMEKLSEQQKNAVMMWLSFKGDLAGMKVLLECHEVDTYCTGQGAMPLQWAIMSRSCEMVEYLLNIFKKQVTHMDCRGNAVMHYLSNKCNSFGECLDTEETRMKLVALLKQAGADILAVNKDNELPKDVAGRNGYVELVQYFLQEEDSAKALAEELKAERERKWREESETRNRGLLEAAKEGDRNRVQNWIDNGAAVESTNNQGRNALHVAAYGGHKDVVSDLLTIQHMDVDAVDDDGNTAFHLASMRDNDFATMSRLTQQQCDVTRANNGGLTPLLSAADRESWQVARFIATTNIDTVQATDNNKRTVLHKACLANATEEVAFFASCVEDIDAMDADGETALTIAIRECLDIGIAQSLLDNGASLTHVYLQDRYRSRPALHIAVQFGRLDVVEHILNKHKDNISHADVDGNTPVHTATRLRLAAIVKVLGDNGANLNAADVVGDTCMHIAASLGALDVIKALVSFESTKISSGDVNGFSPLMVARREAHMEVVSFLEEIGAREW